MVSSFLAWKGRAHIVKQTMKRILPLIAVFAMLVMLSACGRQVEDTALTEETAALVETHEAVGVLKAFLPDGEHIRVDHEAIPGFMEAMTMSFAVKDTTLFQSVLVEDSIRFTLTVTGDDMYVSSLDKVEPR